MKILLLDFGIRMVCIRSEQSVLGKGDAAQDLAGLVYLVVQIQLLHTGLDRTFRIGPVVYGKIARITYGCRIVAQETDEHGVESAHHKGTGAPSDQERDTFLHLLRSLLGKGKGQHPCRIRTFCQNIRHPAGQDLGLARSGASHNKKRPLSSLNSAFLFLVQALQYGFSPFISIQYLVLHFHCLISYH